MLISKGYDCFRLTIGHDLAMNDLFPLFARVVSMF